MKMTKKLLALAGGVAILASAFVFTSCSEDDDDTEGAISGSGNNYSITYKNEDTKNIYRCTNTTTFKHLGELVKIEIKNQTSDSKDGVMGFIWDLKQSKDAESVTEGATTTKPAITASGYQNFFSIGFQKNYDKVKSESYVRYYVSKFFNVSDLQANNFGAPESDTVTTHKAGIGANTPKELVVKSWTKLDSVKVDSNGTVTVWVDIYPVYTNSTYGQNIEAHSSDVAGTYIVDIYTADPTTATTATPATPVETVTINPSVTGYNAEPAQGTLAVYANVQPNKTLNGSWELKKDYAAAEVVEE
ncbi:hypothetical protein [Treponema berlinense]|uniref:hypothetical protein n=1 Tax=Treponema berlinense TaxID=225004 RepID=UPI0026EAF795|nr:hypothetical protein [Treponema berlinense]